MTRKWTRALANLFYLKSLNHPGRRAHDICLSRLIAVTFAIVYFCLGNFETKAVWEENFSKDQIHLGLLLHSNTLLPELI